MWSHRHGTAAVLPTLPNSRRPGTLAGIACFLQENYILDRLEIANACDFPDEALAGAVNTQARLMTGVPPEQNLEGFPEML